jgi:outer membrane protein assembly factor BamE
MISAFYRRPGAFAGLLAAALLAGCKTSDLPAVPGVTPYRMVIQQGNFISQEMVAQLKPGMTKEQVRFVLGTPLVTDIFHADRWDYVFYREMPGGKREQRNLSVIFEKERLARVIGDLMPSEGAAPQAGGFDSQFKSSAKPAAPPPKPAAEAPKPAVEPAKPVADAAKPAEEAKKPEAAKAEETKAEEPKEERGWFGRMLEKIGL